MLNDPLSNITTAEMEAELARRKQAPVKPQPVANPDWTRVVELCTDYVTNDGATDMDTEGFIFEAAIDAVFGPKVVWAYVNRSR